jgi:hypothetical protein
MGALMHSAVTYHKHEPWEEYSTLLGDIELNSNRLLELSLANYTQDNDVNIAQDNFYRWQADLSRIYSTSDLTLHFVLATGQMTIDGVPLSYNQGLSTRWNQVISASSAQSSFTISVGSMGLDGYSLTTRVFLRLEVINASSGFAYVLVTKENNAPITDLDNKNFRVNGLATLNVTSLYDRSREALVYRLGYQGNPPSVEVRVWDHRGILVVGQKSAT